MTTDSLRQELHLAASEDYHRIMHRVGYGLLAGLAGTLVLSLLELTKGLLPQLETIRFLEHVSVATAHVTGLPVLPMAGWLWHFTIGILWWGSLYGFMWPLLPGSRSWVKGVVFGVIAGLLVLLMVMPLAGAGYFGMHLTWLEPLVSMVYHMVYGIVLGAVYGMLTQRRTGA
ncbi:MAG: hypothetical protein PVG22_00610 [Chromatiales bacterium]|jgi:hypothetical protein